jgi:hypothetical protein
MTALLDKAAILAASDLKTVDVDVPEWGGTVRVRSMTGTDRDAFESSLVTIGEDGARKPDMTNFSAKLVAMTLVDPDGKLMFGADEVAHLAGKSAAALQRVFEAAQKLNGMGNGADEAAAKNSGAGLSEGSTSA